MNASAVILAADCKANNLLVAGLPGMLAKTPCYSLCLGNIFPMMLSVPIGFSMNPVIAL